ncbi:MAG: preprotein translocase subunit SecE [Lachnospiraceae bacterium]|nr:preprotein translocase subunit SecE [Lachnospiraceae bacterium]
MSDKSQAKSENFFAGVLKGLKSEWMKIIFPSNEQILKDSITVLVCSIILGLIIFALDSMIGSGLGFLFNR